MDEDNIKEIMKFALGMIILLAGVVMILNHWQDILELFKAMLGLILTAAGLFLLYTFKK